MIHRLPPYRFRGILLFLAAFGALAGCSTEAETLGSVGEQAEDGATTAQYATNGVSFEYPSTWEIEDDWDTWNLGVALIAFEFGDDASMSVLIVPREPNEPVDDPLENYPWEPEVRTEGELGGFQTVEGEHKLDSLGVEIDLRVLAGVQRFEGNQVTVQLGSPADEFEDHRPGFEQLLQTFAIEPVE